MSIDQDIAARIWAIEHDGPAAALVLHRLWPHRIPTHGALTEREEHAIDILTAAITRRIPR